ncbi:MAG: hypothetical protein U0075_14740 [Thermomicrobiales bacterium]
MTDQEQHDEQGGVRERLGDVVHAVQEAVADRVAPVTDHVAPAMDAVTSVLHEAGHAATHLVGRQHDPGQEPAAEPDFGPRLVPSGTQIVRPTKGGTQFLAWREGQWSPVHREQGTGWVWSA